MGEHREERRQRPGFEALMVYNIQILRGIAALSVVFVHLQPQLTRHGGPTLPWLVFGGSGVDLFFVISGFIIWTTTKMDDISPLDFLKRRLIRIVPLYWILTTVVVVTSLLMPSILSTTVFSFDHVLASYLFLPWRHPILLHNLPILIPGWSLNYEFFFYLLFAAGLSSRARPTLAIFIIGSIATLVLFGCVIRPGNAQLMTYSNPIMLEFALGIGIGVMYNHCACPPAWSYATAVVLGACLLLAFGVAGFANVEGSSAIGGAFAPLLFAGLPSTLIVWGATAAKRGGNDFVFKPLVMLGDASYSLYLTQVIALPAGAKLWSAAGIGFEGRALPAFMAFEIALAVAVGLLVCRLVERPLLSALRTRYESTDRHRSPSIFAAARR